MKLPKLIRSWLYSTLLQRTVDKRPPDFIIGSSDDPYMLRWWIIPRNKVFNIYFHHFLKSDEDGALHDHPWWNISILLSNEYTEHTIKDGGINVRTIYKEGTIKMRTAKAAHRVELHNGSCYSLFITGPVVREWGFHCPQGWKHFKDFLSQGKGCD